MIEIDLNNVEELVFHERDFVDFIPDFHQYYDQWYLSRTNPYLKDVGRKALMNFLNNITEKQKSKIEEKFGEKVQIDRPNKTGAYSFDADVDSLESLLNETNPYGYPRLFRKGQRVFVTVWR
jgi:hypothetical protein